MFNSQTTRERWGMDSDYIAIEMKYLIGDCWNISYENVGIKLVYSGNNSSTDFDNLFLIFLLSCLTICFIVAIVSCCDKICCHNEVFQVGSLFLFAAYFLDFFSGMFFCILYFVFLYFNCILLICFIGRVCLCKDIQRNKIKLNKNKNKIMVN